MPASLVFPFLNVFSFSPRIVVRSSSSVLRQVFRYEPDWIPGARGLLAAGGGASPAERVPSLGELLGGESSSVSRRL